MCDQCIRTGPRCYSSYCDEAVPREPMYCSKACKDAELKLLQKEYNDLGRTIARRTTIPYPVENA